MGDGCQKTKGQDVSRSEENKQQGVSQARNWFTSLSRRSKSAAQQQQAASHSSDPTDRKNFEKSTKKNDKNIFQRFRKQVEKKWPGCRMKSSSLKSGEITGGRETEEKNRDDFENFSKVGNSGDLPLLMEADERRKYLAEKLAKDSDPNIVMYNACSEMLSHAWYWGKISRFEAQRQLKDTPNGSFLIRDSEKNGSQFTLSFRMWDRTLHYRIQYYDNYWHFESRKYESMVDMVENFMYRSADEVFVCFVQRPSEMLPPYPVVLRYPISRYSKITALQELCRRAIQRNMDQKEIGKLPIPAKLKAYLAEEVIMDVL